MIPLFILSLHCTFSGQCRQEGPRGSCSRRLVCIQLPCHPACPRALTLLSLSQPPLPWPSLPPECPHLLSPDSWRRRGPPRTGHTCTSLTPVSREDALPREHTHCPTLWPLLPAGLGPLLSLAFSAPQINSPYLTPHSWPVDLHAQPSGF